MSGTVIINQTLITDHETFQVLGSRPSALTNIWIGDKKLNLLSTKVSTILTLNLI